MKDYGDPSNVNKVLEIMKKDKPQLINKTSTVGEVEDAVKQNEVDDASVNADAIAASSEDNIVQPDDLESGIQEPENFDDLSAVSCTYLSIISFQSLGSCIPASKSSKFSGSFTSDSKSSGSK